VSSDPVQLPGPRFCLKAYPNPFSDYTTVQFSLPDLQNSNFKGTNLVLLKIFDAAGTEVATLLNQQLQPGHHEMIFNACGLSAGVYYCRMIVNADGNREITRQSIKMVISKE
jgi:hypothetical protein